MNQVPIGTCSSYSNGNDCSHCKGGVVSRIMALSWGVFGPELLSLPPQDIVLASDCFYDSKGMIL